MRPKRMARLLSIEVPLSWKILDLHGPEGSLELCEYAESIVVKSDELEMVAPRTSYNICFRYKVAEKDANRFNLALRTKLYQEGVSLVGVAYIDGKMVMRLLVTNPDAIKGDVDNFFSHVIEIGNSLVQN